MLEFHHKRTENDVLSRSDFLPLSSCIRTFNSYEKTKLTLIWLYLNISIFDVRVSNAIFVIDKKRGTMEWKNGSMKRFPISTMKGSVKTLPTKHSNRRKLEIEGKFECFSFAWKRKISAFSLIICLELYQMTYTINFE